MVSMRFIGFWVSVFSEFDDLEGFDGFSAASRF